MRSWQPSSSSDGGVTGVMPPVTVEDVRFLRGQFADFMLSYKFAIDEIITKINILRADFNNANEYNPIEHINSRLKSPESVLEKVSARTTP